VFEPRSAKPSSEMHTWSTRLLQSDRVLAATSVPLDPRSENFAFYSMDAPGRAAIFALA